MSKGGSTSSSVEIPAWLENAAIENINRARDVQRIGYTPYYGPDVAAFSPMQTQAMQATGMGAEAFGLAPSGFDPMAGMPQPQQFAGGLMGYSSAPLYEQSVDMLRQQRPAQASALEGLFIDPITGQYSAPSYAPTQEQIEQTAYTERARNAARDAAFRQAEIDNMITAEDVASAVDDTLDYRFGDLTSGIQSAQRSIDDFAIPESPTAQDIAEATDRQLNYRFGDLTDYVGGRVDSLGQDVNYQLDNLDIPVYDGPSTDDIVSQVLAGIPEYDIPTTVDIASKVLEGIPESATAQDIAEATDKQLKYRFGDLAKDINDSAVDIGKDFKYQLGDLDIPKYDGPSTDDIVKQVLAGIPEYNIPTTSDITSGLMDVMPEYDIPTTDDIVKQVLAGIPEYQIPTTSDIVSGVKDIIPTYEAPDLDLPSTDDIVKQVLAGMPEYNIPTTSDIVSGVKDAMPVYEAPEINLPSTDDIVSKVLAGMPKYEQPAPSVVIGDTRYVLDPTMTPTIPTLGDTGSQVFTLDGELVEDTLTRPSVPAVGGITLGDQYTNDSPFNYDPVPESMTSGYTLGSRPEVVMGGGMSPPDVGLGDVVGNAAGLALNTGLLGTVTKGLTGNYPVQNTPEEAAAIPVMDFGTVTSALPPVNTVASKPSKKKSSTSSLASQGPTGTYNQKYWADKLKSGASQAELKAEQDKIKAAGGKVYKGSTPSKPKTNKKSSSSTSSK